MIDVTEILVHWHAGRSQSEVSESLGVDRKTVKKYLTPAMESGIVPGDVARSKEQWEELVRGWFPGLVDTRLRQVTWPEIEPHRDYVVAQLQAGSRRRRSTSGCATSTA